jgi:hypothetical protein
MVTLSTGLPLEPDNGTSWFGQLLHSIFQRFRRTSSIRAGNALDRVAQQVRDIVLMYLSHSQFRCKCAPQIVANHTGFNLLTKWNSFLLTGFAENIQV